MADDTRIRAALPTHRGAARSRRRAGARIAPRPPQGPGARAVAGAGGDALVRAVGTEVRLAPAAVGDEVTQHAPGSARRATCCCWRTSATSRGRPRTTPSWPRSWPSWPTPTSTMPSAPPTVPTPPPRGWRGCCPSMRRGCCWSARWRRSRSLLQDPSRPLVAVLGGAKVGDKIGVIESFLRSADTILIGGAMCFPFFAAQGHSVGASLCEAEDVELARQAIAAAPATRGRRSRCPATWCSPSASPPTPSRSRWTASTSPRA